MRVAAGGIRGFVREAGPSPAGCANTLAPNAVALIMSLHAGVPYSSRIS
jgi:hypothetical protein